MLTLGGIILLFVLSIGLWVRLRTVSAVQELVSTLSDGKYALKASSIRLDPFHMRFKARDLWLYPLHKGTDNTEFELKAHDISLELTHIFDLLLFKKLHVKSLAIDQPNLELRVFEKTNQGPPQPLHFQVARIQNILFKVLESLQVRKFQLRQGSIAYYPELNQSAGRYYLNHLDLGIDNLHLLEKFTAASRNNEAQIHLELKEPTIEYPDSTILVNLTHLDWNTLSHHFEITGLGFHKSVVEKGDSSGFQLQGIELDSLNWNKLLSQGVVELGELKARKGSFTSNNFSFKRRTRDSARIERNGSLLDVIGPITVHRLAIREIEFQVNTHTRRGKETIRIDGDHFDVAQLVVDKNLPNKVEVDELNLKVRAFLETDSNRTFQSGFAEVQIERDNLTLKDYYLHSLASNKLLGENLITVKALTLEGLSIGDLIAGKLKARELVLNAPKATINLPAARKPAKEQRWERFQSRVRRKLDIGKLRINNGSFTIRRHGEQKPFFQTDSFYAIIASRSILRSQSLEELFAAENSFSMPKLSLRLPSFAIDFTRASYANNSFSAATADGQDSAGRLRFHVNGLQARDLNVPNMLHHPDSLLLREIQFGSGTVDLQLSGSRNSEQAKPPSRIVQTIRSGPLQLRVQHPDWQLESQLDSVYIDRLEHGQGSWTWTDFLLQGRSLVLHQPKVEGVINRFELQAHQPSVFYNSQWSIDQARWSATATIPALTLKTELRSSARLLEAAESVSLKEPVIQVLLKKLQQPGEEAPAGKPLDLPAITLSDPEIRIRRESGDSLRELASTDGGRLFIDRLHLGEDGLNTRALQLDLNNLSTHQHQFALLVPFLKLHTGELNLKKGEPVQTLLKALQVQSGKLEIDRDTKKLSVNGIDIQLEQDYWLNTEKDSLKRLLTTLPHLNLKAKKFFYEHAGRQLIVDALEVASDKKQILLDSLQYTATIDRDSFFRQAGVQKDFIQLAAGPSILNGYQMIDRGTDTVWQIEQGNFMHLNMLVDRNKQYPSDTVSYRPLFTGMLQRLPIKFELEHLNLAHANIRYNEISEKKGREGSIWFGDLGATISNIKNFDIRASDSLTIAARTLLMDKGFLQFNFRESYTDSLQGFYLLARMGKMDLKALSPLLLPLFNVKIERGLVDTLWLRARANDYLAYGKMEMDYHRLKLSLLRDDGRKKGFTSFLLNTVLKGKNNKVGLVYKDRMRNKAMFNYWGKIALSGLLSNMGVLKNKKYTRKYNKEMKNLNLPPDLLTE